MSVYLVFVNDVESSSSSSSSSLMDRYLFVVVGTNSTVGRHGRSRSVEEQTVESDVVGFGDNNGWDARLDG